MPRSPRLDHPGARHLVMNRGARRAPIFTTDEACALFLDLVADLPRLFGVRVHGYALMPNHYHLMLESVRGNLSRAMRHVGGVFSQRLNRIEPQWDGPIFRGRYRNEVVADDNYWRHLLAYLHLNPVKANLAKTPDGVLWTSHDAYTGGCKKPDWLTTEELLGMFDSVKGYRAYVRGVHVGRIEAPEGFDPVRFFTPPSSEIAPPRPRAVAKTAEAALDDVARVTGMRRKALLELRRGPGGNPAAWLAAWWLPRATDLPQQRVAAVLGVSRPRISQLRRQLVTRAKTDSAVRDWMDTLESMESGEV